MHSVRAISCTNGLQTEGLAEGRVEGQTETNLEIARKALAEGASIEFVQKITGLSSETIEAL